MTPRKPERTRRLQVFLSADEIAAIDDFRFKARMPNRAAAVRQLLMRGLASAKKRSVDPCHFQMSPPTQSTTLLPIGAPTRRRLGSGMQCCCASCDVRLKTLPDGLNTPRVPAYVRSWR